MITFFKIQKELKRANQPLPLCFNDKKTLAYHHVNHIYNNIYEIRSLTTSNENKGSNLLYITGDNKTYKIVNFKNENIESVLEKETVASKDTIPEILAQLGQKNSQTDFEFYEKPFDILQRLRYCLGSINRVFIFSKKCKQALYATVLKLNDLLNAKSDETQLKLNDFLGAFNTLIEEVNKNQKTARRSYAIQSTVVGTGIALSLFGCFMPIFITAGLTITLVVPVILSGLLIFCLGFLFASFSAASYGDVYPSKGDVSWIDSLHTQVSFFSENLKNKNENIENYGNTPGTL